MAAILPLVLAALAALTLLTAAPPSTASPLGPDPLEVGFVPPDTSPPSTVGATSAEGSDPTPEPDVGVTTEGPPVYFMPVEGVSVADVWPSFGDPRGNDRSHLGVDIMAERGTPVRSAAAGVVWRSGESGRGGVSVTVIGDDGVRYFYTHLDSVAPGIDRGQRVGTDTVIGYVGNTGNAAGTAPHLHFEVALPVEGREYAWEPIDPLTYMLDR